QTAPLDDLQHFSRQPAIASPDGLGANDVAVERSPDVLRRDEEIVVAPAVAEQRGDEAVSFGLEVDHSGDFRSGLAHDARRLPLAVHARALEHGGRRPARLRPPRIPDFLATIAVVGAVAHLAVDMPVIDGSPLLQEAGQGPAQRMPMGMSEMELPEEFLE